MVSIRDYNNGRVIVVLGVIRREFVSISGIYYRRHSIYDRPCRRTYRILCITIHAAIEITSGVGVVMRGEEEAIGVFAKF